MNGGCSRIHRTPRALKRVLSGAALSRAERPNPFSWTQRTDEMAARVGVVGLPALRKENAGRRLDAGGQAHGSARRLALRRSGAAPCEQS